MSGGGGQLWFFQDCWAMEGTRTWLQYEVLLGNFPLWLSTSVSDVIPGIWDGRQVGTPFYSMHEQCLSRVNIKLSIRQPDHCDHSQVPPPPTLFTCVSGNVIIITCYKNNGSPDTSDWCKKSDSKEKKVLCNNWWKGDTLQEKMKNNYKYLVKIINTVLQRITFIVKIPITYTKRQHPTRLWKYKQWTGYWARLRLGPGPRWQHGSGRVEGGSDRPW